MAQASSSSSRRGSATKSRGSTRSKSASSRSGNSSKSGERKRAATSRAKQRAGKPEAATNGLSAATDTAVEGTKTAGRAVASLVSNAKVPLIAGGAMAAAAAGGLALKGRRNSHGRLDRIKLPDVSLPDINIDRESIASAAERVGQIGRRVSEVASAVQHTAENSKQS